MTAPWQAARSASRRPLRKYKQVGPVGPTVVASESAAAVMVNGVRLSADEAFSLGIDIPELGISAHGPMGKRGDGRPTCEGCGYHVCSCATITITFAPPSGDWGLPKTMAGKMQLLDELYRASPRHAELQAAERELERFKVDAEAERRNWKAFCELMGAK